MLTKCFRQKKLEKKKHFCFYDTLDFVQKSAINLSTKTEMSRRTTKPTNDMCAQRRLSLAWASAEQSSLCAQEVVKDPMFLHADSEDSAQTGRMPRLTWVFAERTGHFVGFVMRRLKSNGTHVRFTELEALFVVWFNVSTVWAEEMQIRRKSFKKIRS